MLCSTEATPRQWAWEWGDLQALKTSPGVCCSQKPECPDFIISASSDYTFLPHCGLCDGLISLMAQRDSPTLRTVPTPQGHPQGTQRDHTQAKEHKDEGRHWVAVGSQCSPVDFSRDLEEGEKALSVVTGCSSAAEGVTWEKPWPRETDMAGRKTWDLCGGKCS